MKKDKTFEEKLNELELIVKMLENGEINLDDAISQYTIAMKLAKECTSEIEDATTKISKIFVDGKLKDFCEEKQD